MAEHVDEIETKNESSFVDKITDKIHRHDASSDSDSEKKKVKYDDDVKKQSPVKSKSNRLFGNRFIRFLAVVNVFGVAKLLGHHARFRSTIISGGGRIRPPRGCTEFTSRHGGGNTWKDSSTY